MQIRQLQVPIGKAQYQPSPVVQDRWFWERQKKQGGRVAVPEGARSYASCALCTVLMGREYGHREAYLAPLMGQVETPSKRGRRSNAPGGKRGSSRGQRRVSANPPPWQWRLICGTCADHEVNLPFPFVLIAERDWEHPITAPWLADLDVIPPEIIVDKVRNIEHQLIPLWNKRIAREADDWRTKQGFYAIINNRIDWVVPQQQILAEVIGELAIDMYTIGDIVDMTILPDAA